MEAEEVEAVAEAGAAAGAEAAAEVEATAETKAAEKAKAAMAAAVTDAADAADATMAAERPREDKGCGGVVEKERLVEALVCGGVGEQREGGRGDHISVPKLGGKDAVELTWRDRWNVGGGSGISSDADRVVDKGATLRLIVQILVVNAIREIATPARSTETAPYAPQLMVVRVKWMYGSRSAERKLWDESRAKGLPASRCWRSTSNKMLSHRWGHGLLCAWPHCSSTMAWAGEERRADWM